MLPRQTPILNPLVFTPMQLMSVQNKIEAPSLGKIMSLKHLNLFVGLCIYLFWKSNMACSLKEDDDNPDSFKTRTDISSSFTRPLNQAPGKFACEF